MALFYLISRKCRLQSTADRPQSERGNNQMRWDSANSVRDGTSSPVCTSRSHIAARLWQPSTNMVSVLPDGAEPRGSNRERRVVLQQNYCQLTPTDFSLSLSSPLYLKAQSAFFFSQLWQLREVMAFARPTVAKKASLTSFARFSRALPLTHHSALTLKRSAIINRPCIPQGPP